MTIYNKIMDKIIDEVTSIRNYLKTTTEHENTIIIKLIEYLYSQYMKNTDIDFNSEDLIDILAIIYYNLNDKEDTQFNLELIEIFARKELKNIVDKNTNKSELESVSSGSDSDSETHLEAEFDIDLDDDFFNNESQTNRNITINRNEQVNIRSNGMMTINMGYGPVTVSRDFGDRLEEQLMRQTFRFNMELPDPLMEIRAFARFDNILLHLQSHQNSFNTPQQEQVQTGEDVKKILPKDELDKLTRIKYSELDKKDEYKECPILKLEFEEDDEVIQLDCEHVFNESAIVQWLGKMSNTCPLCRKEVGTKYEFA